MNPLAINSYFPTSPLAFFLEVSSNQHLKRHMIENLSIIYIKKNKKQTKIDEYLVSKANSENLFLQGVEFPQQGNEFADPNVVWMSITATTGDHKSIVPSNLFFIRKLTCHHSINIPFLSLRSQHSHKNPKIPSVFLLDVFWILCTQQNGESFLTHHSRSKLVLFLPLICLLPLPLFLSETRTRRGVFVRERKERETERDRERDWGDPFSRSGIQNQTDECFRRLQGS